MANQNSSHAVVMTASKCRNASLLALAPSHGCMVAFSPAAVSAGTMPTVSAFTAGATAAPIAPAAAFATGETLSAGGSCAKAEAQSKARAKIVKVVRAICAGSTCLLVILSLCVMLNQS